MRFYQRSAKRPLHPPGAKHRIKVKNPDAPWRKRLEEMTKPALARQYRLQGFVGDDLGGVRVAAVCEGGVDEPKRGESNSGCN